MEHYKIAVFILYYVSDLKKIVKYRSTEKILVKVYQKYFSCLSFCQSLACSLRTLGNVGTKVLRWRRIHISLEMRLHVATIF